VDPIVTLYERTPVPASSLPPELAERYGGGLVVPERGPGGRPYVIANFVETVDGVTSFAVPGHFGGGDISGFNEPDRVVMGLLRARADAVIFGSGTLHEDSGHVRTAPFVYPDLADAYAALRRQIGRGEPHPLNVVVSASGHVDLAEPTFHHPVLRVLIATTPAGHARLADTSLPPGVEVRVVSGAPDRSEELHPTPGAADGGVQPAAPLPIATGVDPAALLAMLGREYGVRVALHEGGPHLLAAFLAAGLLDELFLTLAPQFAGRAPGAERPALLEGHAFAPGAAPWGQLLSVKRAGEHLFLRYAIEHAETREGRARRSTSGRRTRE
jgi:riboflavin biosynthesis pyrimidine reductase